ncbi:MAG TPA: C4-type zinc ribbon domain-containing protein [Chthoniobacterales bacterium]
MLQAIEQLLILQDRDQKIRGLKVESQRAPEDKKRIADDLAKATAAFEKARQTLRELEVRKQKLELDAQAKRDSIAKFKTQQFQTRKNEEFQAFGHEIARYERDVVLIEDQEIEIMEESEILKAGLIAQEQEFAAARQLAASRTQALEERIATIKQRLADLEADRAALAAPIEEDLMYRYTRLFDKKNGHAVVALEHEVCMGCHMKVTPQTVHAVKGGRELTSCEHCGRMLYYGE